MKRWILIVSVLLAAVACKKSEIVPPDTEDPTPQPSKNENELIADSVFLFSKEIYYWQDKIGSVTYDMFNPLQYLKPEALNTAKAVIGAVRNYNEWDKAKGYSYAENYSGDGASSKAAMVEFSYGFDVKPAWKTRTPDAPIAANFEGWYVSYVYPDSDAGKKGVQRGMKLLSVDGTPMGNTAAAVAILNNMLYYETLKSVNAQFLKPNGDTLQVNISITSFVPNSLLYASIFTTPKSKKVGYLVYNFFDRLSDSKAQLDSLFNAFRAQHLDAVVIDLRYNRGGYTETQDYLTNHVAPLSAHNKLMYRYHFNSNLQTGNYTALKTRYPASRVFALDYASNNIKFNTLTSLNTDKIYIITSNETASSSELFINNLKPQLGEKLVLIGDDVTRGKPVGFFPIHLFKKVTFWTVSFMTKNGQDEAVPYEGFVPEYLVYDAVDRPWGDVSEECLSAAIKLVDGLEVPRSSHLIVPSRSIIPSPHSQRLRKERMTDNMLLMREE